MTTRDYNLTDYGIHCTCTIINNTFCTTDGSIILLKLTINIKGKMMSRIDIAFFLWKANAKIDSNIKLHLPEPK